MGSHQAVLIAGSDTVADGLLRIADLAVGGLSLLQRAARAAARAGASKLLIIAPDDAVLRAPLTHDPFIPIEITWHTSPEPLSHAAIALRQALHLIEPLCWLLSADQVLSPPLFVCDDAASPKKDKDKGKSEEKSKSEKSKDKDPDKDKDDKKSKDKKDDKKSKGARAIFPVFANGDTPSLVFLERAALEEVLATEVESLGGILNALRAARGRDVVVEGRNAVWGVVRDEAQGAQVFEKLMGSLRKPLGRDADGFVAYYLNRPLSLMMSRRLVNTKLTPNQVTSIALAMGVMAGVVVSFGGWGWLILGGILLQLSSILDGVDGELARLRLAMTKSGEWFDTVCDDIINLGFMFGLASACAVRLGSVWPTYMGWFTLVVGSALILSMYVELIRVGAASHNAFKWGFEPDAKAKDKNKDKTPETTGAGLWKRAVVIFSYVAKRDSYNLIMACLLFFDFYLFAFLLMSFGIYAITGGYIVQKVGTWTRGAQQ